MGDKAISDLLAEIEAYLPYQEALPYREGEVPLQVAAKCAGTTNDPGQKLKGALGQELHRYLRKGCPSEMFSLLAASSDGELRTEVARSPFTPSELLASLAADSSLNVAAAVLENPRCQEHCAVEILQRMSSDTNAFWRQCAATDSRTPPATLCLLATDQDLATRLNAINNSNLPEQDMNALCSGLTTVEWNHLARMATLEQRLLAQLPLKALDWESQMRLLSFDFNELLLTPSTLEVLSTSHDVDIRFSVLKHPALTQNVAERLQDDPAPLILKLAVEKVSQLQKQSKKKVTNSSAQETKGESPSSYRALQKRYPVTWNRFAHPEDFVDAWLSRSSECAATRFEGWESWAPLSESDVTKIRLALDEALSPQRPLSLADLSITTMDLSLLARGRKRYRWGEMRRRHKGKWPPAFYAWPENYRAYKLMALLAKDCPEDLLELAANAKRDKFLPIAAKAHSQIHHSTPIALKTASTGSE